MLDNNESPSLFPLADDTPLADDPLAADDKVALLYQRCSIANSKQLQSFNTTTSNNGRTRSDKKNSWKDELDEFRLFISS